MKEDSESTQKGMVGVKVSHHYTFIRMTQKWRTVLVGDIISGVRYKIALNAAELVYFKRTGVQIDKSHV